MSERVCVRHHQFAMVQGDSGKSWRVHLCVAALREHKFITHLWLHYANRIDGASFLLWERVVES